MSEISYDVFNNSAIIFLIFWLYVVMYYIPHDLYLHNK